MAKTSRSARGGKKEFPEIRGIKWPSNAVCELLAWLELCRAKNSTGNFKSTIEQHLQSCGFHFTSREADHKLRDIWQSQGLQRKGSQSRYYTEIYKEGIHCLRPEYLASVKGLENRIAELNDHAIASHEEQLTSPRSLRSTVPRDSPWQESLHVRLQDTRDHWTRSVSRSVPQSDSRTATEAVTINPTPDGEAVESLTGPGPISFSLSGPDTIPNTPRDFKREVSELDTIDVAMKDPLHGSTIPGSDSSLSPLDDYFSTLDDFPDSPLPQRFNQGDRPQQKSLKRRRAPRRRRTTKHSKKQNNQKNQNALIAFLRTRLEDSESKIKCYEARTAAENRFVAEQRHAPPGSTGPMLLEKEEQIKTLQMQLADKEWLRPFSSLGACERAPFDNDAVRDLMMMIETNMQQLFGDDIYQDNCTWFSPEGHTVLEPLLCKSFGVETVDRFVSQFSHDLLPQMRLEHLFRSLISSALCMWVFEDNISDMFPLPCELFSIAQHHLRTLDGEVAVRNLDFAIHRTYIERDEFQKFKLPRKILDLTNRLLDALASLCQLQDLEFLGEAWDGIECLRTIFDAALRIKLQAMLSTETFQAQHWPPGTRYRSKSMNLKCEARRLEVAPPPSSPSVLICLLPGLARSKGSLRLVDYNSFVHMEEAELEPNGTLTKASIVGIGM